MKKARISISHFGLILFNLKISGEIVTTYQNASWLKKNCEAALATSIRIPHNNEERITKPEKHYLWADIQRRQ